MKRWAILAMAIWLLVILGGVAYAVTLTPQTITTTGLVVTPVTATDTAYEFNNTGREFIYINNAYTDTLNYTITILGTVGGYALEDITGSVVSGTAKYIGPFNPVYANAADGNVDFTIDIIDGNITLAILRLP